MRSGALDQAKHRVSKQMQASKAFHESPLLSHDDGADTLHDLWLCISDADALKETQLID